MTKLYNNPLSMGLRGDDAVRTLSIDPGKRNTWAAFFVGTKLKWIGKIDTPLTIAGILDPRFQAQIRDFLLGFELQAGRDEVVVERFTHRGRGGKGSMAEIMHGLIDTIIIHAIQLGLQRHLLVAGAHKNSYNKYHPDRYPRELIEKMVLKHGFWRPKLKVMEPNEHCRDCLTIGMYRILKRTKRIK